MRPDMKVNEVLEGAFGGLWGPGALLGTLGLPRWFPDSSKTSFSRRRTRGPILAPFKRQDGSKVEQKSMETIIKSLINVLIPKHTKFEGTNKPANMEQNIDPKRSNRNLLQSKKKSHWRGGQI